MGIAAADGYSAALQTWWQRGMPRTSWALQKASSATCWPCLPAPQCPAQIPHSPADLSAAVQPCCKSSPGTLVPPLTNRPSLWLEKSFVAASEQLRMCLTLDSTPSELCIPQKVHEAVADLALPTLRREMSVPYVPHSSCLPAGRNSIGRSEIHILCLLLEHIVITGNLGCQS